MANPCLVPGLKDTQVCKVAGVVHHAAGAVQQAVDFAKDPLGYVAQQMQAAASGLSSTVLPELEKLTHPDLATAWFLSAYRVSFALAMFVFVAFLGWNFVQLARRRVSGDEVAETMAVYTPLFLGGVIFGPLAGTMLLALTGAVTDALIGWGVSGSVDGTTKALQAAIAAGDPAKIVGGSIVAIILFGCLIVALLLAFVVLLVMLVTLYLTGAIIPLSLVWLVHPRQRTKGLKVVMVWVGICFSHVLLFLLLGVAFHMVGGLSTSFDQPGMTILADLAVAVIALLLATLSPLGLLAFAPVGPSAAAGGGPSLSVPGQRSVGGGYPESAGDSQTAQMARGNDATGDTGAGGGAGGVLGTVTAGQDGGVSSSSMEPAGGAGVDGAAGPGGDTAAGGGPGPGAGSSSAGPAASAVAAGDGTAAVAAGSDGAENAGEKLTAAGTAAEATGAGAPAGVAMQAAGLGLQAAGTAVGATAGLAQSAGEMAAEHMEHGDTHTEGGSGADPRPGR